MFKKKSRIERMALKSQRRFNRKSKNIKYQQSDEWSWTFPIPLKGIPEIVEEKFGFSK